jgi:hypothetical protein
LLIHPYRHYKHMHHGQLTCVAGKLSKVTRKFVIPPK